MARKNRRQQSRKHQRGPSGGGRAARPAGLPPAVAGYPAQAGQAGTPPEASSPVLPSAALPPQRPLPRGPRGRLQAGPLPTQDATIPLDRVPYFRSDLRRIAITAGLMIVLLVAGSIVLRNLLQA
jgi:hypothetical protein